MVQAPLLAREGLGRVGISFFKKSFNKIYEVE